MERNQGYSEEYIHVCKWAPAKLFEETKKKKKNRSTDKNPFTQNKQVKTALNKKMKQISNKNPLYIVTNSWWNR